MEKILVSACLLGEKKRYDGGDNYSSAVEELRKHYDLIPFCPEVEGGLSVPRNPSEIRGSRVVMNDGTNVSRAFNTGAEKALKVCAFLGITIAVLKEGSPSCGTHEIHSGHFDGKMKKGMGITARFLSDHGIKVYSEHEIIDILEAIAIEKAKKEERQEWGRKKRAEKAEADKALSEQKESETPSEEKSFERKPYAKRTYGDKKPYGDRKSYGDKKSYGKKPAWKKDGERKSFGDKKPSWKKEGEGRSSDRPSWKKDGPRKPYKARKDYGEKKDGGNENRPWAKKKSFGGKPSYKKSYGAKRSYGPRKPRNDEKGE